MRKAAEVVTSYADKNDGTAFPFWGIVTKGFCGNIQGEILLAGVWFSRASAQAHLEAKRHRFPKSAHVYCFSGHDSWDFRELIESSQSELRLNEYNEPLPALAGGEQA